MQPPQNGRQAYLVQVVQVFPVTIGSPAYPQAQLLGYIQEATRQENPSHQLVFPQLFEARTSWHGQVMVAFNTVRTAGSDLLQQHH